MNILKIIKKKSNRPTPKLPPALKDDYLSIDPHRIRLLSKTDIIKKGPIVYWMSRDQRVADNWALLYAQKIAFEIKQPLCVVFCLIPSFLGAQLWHYDFMLQGMREIEATLTKLHICFEIVMEDPVQAITTYVKKNDIGALVTDFSPLTIVQTWKKKIKKSIKVPFFEVDAHNIVPCFFASDKQEYSAYTFRHKMEKLIPHFLTEFPSVQEDKYAHEKSKKINWQNIYNFLKIDKSIEFFSLCTSGEKAAQKALQDFIKKRLNVYQQYHNDPTKDAQSNLSPYLHLGQLSAQRIALEIKKLRQDKNTQAFLEELIIRKELSDNFCFYNKKYTSTTSFSLWAKKTLKKHTKDKREYLYTLKQFEDAHTHDPLWNAAQKEMMITGKMHGFMRMYWAKKILEWTKSPKEALKIAVYLNDKYSLDGRDPNGYVGILWSVGGIHDRAFKERKIFGKIRYMNYDGCKRKFDVDLYIKMIENLKKVKNK